MKNMVNMTRNVMRKLMNIEDDMKIIFTGTGCTGAINHFVNMINIGNHDHVTVYLTVYEHHSNFLPWVECEKKFDNFSVRYIENDQDMNIKFDNFFDDLEFQIKKLSGKNHLVLISTTHCSNVTGKMFVDELEKIKAKVSELHGLNKNIYILVDMACSAPYVNIDASLYDGVFFSGHKFLGGQQSPGCLIIRTSMIENECPYNPGGGCVRRADRENIVYLNNIENREPGGTPNIIGIIRLCYVLCTKELNLGTIKLNEEIIADYCDSRFREFIEKYHHFHVIFFDMRKKGDLPIYPIFIDGVHYNMITAMFSDLFGIQTRGGNSCCGMLAKVIQDKYDINGWCRISFNYLLTKDDIEKIFFALEFIINNHKKYFDRYVKNETTNIFTPKI
jgi:selenocysteine lyase/cysteine desulfurase